MSDYQVVNPSTGKVEKEFPTATDAEVQDALSRTHAAYGEWRTTSKDERARILHRVADLYDERADELAAIIAREMGKPLRRGQGRAPARRLDLPLLRRPGPRPARRLPAGPGDGRQRGGPQGADRPAARDHAVELPVLPGGPVRGAQPDDRQHDPAQARPAVPRVGARDRGRSSPTPACRRTPTSTSSPPTSSRPTSSPTPAWWASRSPAVRAGRLRRRRGRRDATSRRSCSSSAAPTPSSCSTPTTSVPR